ncbi:hypothetical protein RND61_25280 [Streptomyces sp. TRM76323]|uniref:Uncharacterized protein n=1 Tax=Streptomyces tamarix TaxID=3078565 RepID=A0ABU3QRF0_9ACTN|nr:hypothetical protein [Streptomyces tamarix]MDT9685350.1 hypothetical protein [Streptomyces tamarix]
MPRYDAPAARRAAGALGAAATAVAAVLLAVLGVLAPAAPAPAPSPSGAPRAVAVDDLCAAVCSAAPRPYADVSGTRSVPPPTGAAPPPAPPDLAPPAARAAAPVPRHGAAHVHRPTRRTGRAPPSPPVG